MNEYSHKPIFRSTGAAVHFAFLLDAYPPAAMSTMGIIMRGVRYCNGSRDIDFDGLSPLEVHTQCQLIKSAVKTRLCEIERWALEARYRVNETTSINGKTETYFSRERYDAILRLSHYLSADIGLSVLGCYLIVARIEDPKIERVTIGKLARDFRKSPNRIMDILMKTERRINTIESAALSSLTPLFIQHSVIER